jgi:DNA-binding SARP family transcriptional activator/Tfp pilus assembly protein PilF
VARDTEFGLLGPLLIRRSGLVTTLPAGKQRAVLALLLLNANRTVLLDEIANVLWGTASPPSAQVTIQNYVKRLRQALDRDGDRRIGTAPRGYLIRVEPDELDVSRFEVTKETARQAARQGDWVLAAARMREALSLWRGEPLADVPSPLLAQRLVPSLTEMRLQALEARIDADLHLGCHADVIAELRQLAGTYPLRERLHALLILALYRDGQQGEALAAYQRARRVLIEELGAEPGLGLRRLEQQVLAADPALLIPADEAAIEVHNAQDPEPRQLPGRVRHFAGRARELQALTSLLDQAGDDAPDTVLISAIDGTAGVGKTALAVHWAHQVAGRFPDGQLYVNLHGYDPGQPMPAADALAGFLRALGVAGQDVPVDADERAARYRSLLAGRKMLVVLDNARDAGQVQPLLPGTPGCMTVVTSRDALPGLVARFGAWRLDLDLLPLTEAVGLLRALIGVQVDADPAAAQTLAAQCARLPLALRVAAEIASARSSAPLVDLVRELDDQRSRLDLLDAGGDALTGVREVFSWSYRQLDSGAAGTFRLLGLHPGPDFDSRAAAALTGATVEQASAQLYLLARAHLVQQAGPERFALHDLLRAYAAELAATDEQRQPALTSLLDYYLHASAAAMHILVPGEQYRRADISPPETQVPAFSGREHARLWLDAHRAILVAVTAHAADHGWPDHAVRLAAILRRYFELGCHYPELVAMNDHALRACRLTGDRAGEAEIFNNRSFVALRQSRFPEATRDIEHALLLYRETGNRAGETIALGRLGVTAMLQGRYSRAARYLRETLARFRDAGDRTSEARTLVNLSLIDLRQGRYQQAASQLRQSLALYRDCGDDTNEANAMANLGVAELRQGRYRQAADHLDHSLTLHRERADRVGEAYALINLAALDLRQHHHDQARARLEQAVALCRQTGDRAGESEACNGLGEVLLAAGRPEDALSEHIAALDLATRAGERYEQARAHQGMAAVYEAAGDLAAAGVHWRQALRRYSRLGTPEAAEVRARLAAADPGDRTAALADPAAQAQ